MTISRLDALIREQEAMASTSRQEIEAIRAETAEAMKPLSEICVRGFSVFFRGYILDEALSSGWLTYEEGRTPVTVGAYLYR